MEHKGICLHTDVEYGCLQESAPAVSGSGQKQSLQDYESYPKDFVRRRLVVFIGIVIG